MSQIFGEISWSDDIFGGGGGEKKNTKDLFLRLGEGSNEVRLVTQPFQYLVHKFKREDDKGYGQKISCSAVHGSCPLCDTGDKAKARWLIGVISRKTNTYKVLDISFAVFSQIRKLAGNAKWGDPGKYDIDIVVDKNGGATGYYTVQPIPKEPLSASDQQIKDNADLDDLKRRVTPMEPKAVQARIDKILGSGPPAEAAPSSVPAPAAKKAAAAATPAKKPAPAQVAMEEESDDDFPAYT